MTKEEKRVFDFRMDVQSWFMLAAMFLAFWLILLPASFDASLADIPMWKQIVLPIVNTFLLVCVSCIPVIIISYLIKRIPDIDYAIWFATVVTIILVLGIVLN